LIPDQSMMFDTLMLGKRAQRIRKEKKLSIEALAKMADVNKNTVVRFEKGLSTRIETIYKICGVLNISPLKLVEGKLVRGRDYDIQKHTAQDTGRATSQRISREQRIQKEYYHGMQVGDLNYQLPGGQLRAKVIEISKKCEFHSHPGEELLFCLTGTVGVEISNVKAVLNKGDAIFFWGTEPHCYFNADKKKPVSVALTVVRGGEQDKDVM